MGKLYYFSFILSQVRSARQCRLADKPTGYTELMRTFSLLFTFIALVLLAQFLIYVIRGPVDPFIAGAIFFSFLVCLAPAVLLLKPFEGREELRRRRERSRKEREERQRTDEPTEGPGS
jgi:hypothetical protein